MKTRTVGTVKVGALNARKIKFQKSSRIYGVITVQLKTKEKGKVLSIVGDLDVNDSGYCGQCLDEMKVYFADNPMFTKIYGWWKEYHLNDIRAGCIHQHEAKWHEVLLDETKPAAADNLAIWKYPLDYSGNAPETSKHAKGLLTKPCPVCGHRYGVDWQYQVIPEEVLKEIEDFIGGNHE